jgi:hypothetical protein
MILTFSCQTLSLPHFEKLSTEITIPGNETRSIEIHAAVYNLYIINEMSMEIHYYAKSKSKLIIIPCMNKVCQYRSAGYLLTIKNPYNRENNVTITEQRNYSIPEQRDYSVIITWGIMSGIISLCALMGGVIHICLIKMYPPTHKTYSKKPQYHCGCGEVISDPWLLENHQPDAKCRQSKTRIIYSCDCRREFSQKKYLMRHQRKF